MFNSCVEMRCEPSGGVASGASIGGCSPDAVTLWSAPANRS